MLKKLIAISFLFLFLSANTEIHQLLRLPVLIHHFLEHQNQEPDETFSNFLKEHYYDHQNHSDHDHQDHHDHDKLPFKTTNCALAYVSLAFVNPIQFSISPSIIFHDKISPSYNGALYFSALVRNIWQPPKIS
jgi:ABC-type Zn2+ transport system substrate-binding protein/surface adhesin